MLFLFVGCSRQNPKTPPPKDDCNPQPLRRGTAVKLFLTARGLEGVGLGFMSRAWGVHQGAVEGAGEGGGTADTNICA